MKNSTIHLLANKLWNNILNAFNLQIKLKNGQQIIKLYPDQIIRVKAEGSYSLLITTEGNILFAKNLAWFENLLDGWGFIRVNRGNIANILHVKYIKSKEFKIIIMSDKHEMRIPRRKRKKILSKLQKVRT